MLCTLVGTYTALIDFTLDGRGLNPLILTHKPRYLVYVHPDNDSSSVTFNTASASIYRTLSNTFRWYLNSFLVITGTSSMYARTMLNPSNI